MSVDTTYLMGYGSWAIVRLRSGDEEPNVSSKDLSSSSGLIIPLLSANYSKSQNVPTASTFDTPLDKTKKSMIRLSSGTNSYSGNISFEL